MLYDVHSGRFADVGRSLTATTGFIPLFLSRLFGIPAAQWQEFVVKSTAEMESMSATERDAYVRAHLPVTTPSKAAAMAFFVFPDAERYLATEAGPQGPYLLKDEYLFQPNVPLVAFDVRQSHDWKPVLPSEEPLSSEARSAIRNVLLRVAGTSEEHRIARALEEARALPSARDIDLRSPGVYLTGHSSVFVKGSKSGVLIDPIYSSWLHSEGGISAIDLHQSVDAVMLTHSHFDHYHLPTLLQFSDRPMVVPAVPRASLVCEQIAQRLKEFHVPDVRSPQWHTSFEVGEFKIHVLPFYGEQFLTSELYPEARSWGNSYVIERDDFRVFIAADSGFEPDRSVIPMIADWVSANGPIDVVLAQSLGLRVCFGEGDPDVQITALACSRKAVDAVEMLRPEHRITLSVSDLPELCSAARARNLVLYGHFQTDVGSPGVRPDLLKAAQSAMHNSGTKLVPLAIGQRFKTTDGHR